MEKLKKDLSRGREIRGIKILNEARDSSLAEDYYSSVYRPRIMVIIMVIAEIRACIKGSIHTYHISHFLLLSLVSLLNLLGREREQKRQRPGKEN